MQFVLILIFFSLQSMFCSKFEEQLYEDLFYYYNKIVRPTANATDLLTVMVGGALIRIIQVDAKNQILTTNLWSEYRWKDFKLKWSPDKYGGIKRLHIPIDDIWVPDVVLYNHAEGHPEIEVYTDAFVYHDGTIVWRPPAIYQSFCEIDVTWFPFDSQTCSMKFGVWSYTGDYIDMKQLPQKGDVVVTREKLHNLPKACTVNARV